MRRTLPVPTLATYYRQIRPSYRHLLHAQHLLAPLLICFDVVLKVWMQSLPETARNQVKKVQLGGGAAPYDEEREAKEVVMEYH